MSFHNDDPRRGYLERVERRGIYVLVLLACLFPVLAHLDTDQ